MPEPPEMLGLGAVPVLAAMLAVVEVPELGEMLGLGAVPVLQVGAVPELRGTPGPGAMPELGAVPELPAAPELGALPELVASLYLPTRSELGPVERQAVVPEAPVSAVARA